MRWLTALLLTASAVAQITAPIRNKLSAGDRPSAESILEGHERKKGRDAHHLDGLVWVTRGAVLLGTWDRAADLQSQLRAGPNPAKDPTNEAALLAALGAQIEVQAYAKGRKPAVAYLDAELARFP